MKKLIILLLLVAFCGGSTGTSTVEATTSTSTLTFQPATTIKSQYDSLSSKDKIAVKFRSYWIQNILKTDVTKLTNEELEISYNRAENPIDYFEMKDVTQYYKKTGGLASGDNVD